MFQTMQQVRKANADAGHYWFEPSAFRLFRSRVGRTLYGGRYFISSEQFVSSDGWKGPRKYSVREVSDDGSIDTVGKFQAYETAAQARAAIRKLLAER